MVFWVKPGVAQELLLALHSGVIPGEIRGPYEMLGIGPRSPENKPTVLSAVLLLRPQDQFNFVCITFSFSNSTNAL